MPAQQCCVFGALSRKRTKSLHSPLSNRLLKRNTLGLHPSNCHPHSALTTASPNLLPNVQPPTKHSPAASAVRRVVTTPSVNRPHRCTNCHETHFAIISFHSITYRFNVTFHFVTIFKLLDNCISFFHILYITSFIYHSARTRHRPACISTLSLLYINQSQDHPRALLHSMERELYKSLSLIKS